MDFGMGLDEPKKVYTCSGALFHKLREHLHNSEFSTDEMEMILESILITEEQ